MRYRIKQIIPHGDSVKEFTLVPSDGADVPRWKPGAHGELTLTSKEGIEHKNCYSLISGASQELRIAVLRNPTGRGGSKVLHDEMDIGTEIELKGPVDSFALNPGTNRNVLIAGGIGITPIVSMAHALSTTGHQFELHYIAKDPSRFLLLDEVATLPHGEIKTYTTLDSRPDLHRIINSYALGSELHACGPVSLMHAISHAATHLAWPENKVHFESFGPQSSTHDQPLNIHLRQSGMSITVLPGTTILDAMISADAFVSYDCKRGECGSCFATVLSGQPVHRDVCLTPEQRAIGMTTCVSWASTSELELDI